MARSESTLRPRPSIIVLVLLGQVLELRARHRTGSALRALARSRPQRARLVRDGEETDVPLDQVQKGDQPSRPSRRKNSR